MTTFPNSPKLLKGGIVLIDPETAHVKRIISLQYNPESLSRTLQVQGFGESGDRSETLWLGTLPLERLNSTKGSPSFIILTWKGLPPNDRTWLCAAARAKSFKFYALECSWVAAQMRLRRVEWALPEVVPSVKRKNLWANRCKRSYASMNRATSTSRKRTVWRSR